MTLSTEITPDTEIREMAADDIDLVGGGATWFESLVPTGNYTRRENVLDGFTRRLR